MVGQWFFSCATWMPIQQFLHDGPLTKTCPVQVKPYQCSTKSSTTKLFDFTLCTAFQSDVLTYDETHFSEDKSIIINDTKMFLYNLKVNPKYRLQIPQPHWGLSNPLRMTCFALKRLGKPTTCQSVLSVASSSPHFGGPIQMGSLLPSVGEGQKTPTATTVAETTAIAEFWFVWLFVYFVSPDLPQGSSNEPIQHSTATWTRNTRWGLCFSAKLFKQCFGYTIENKSSKC